MMTADHDTRVQALDRAVHRYMTQGWVIESRTDLSVSLGKGKLNNPMWFIISLVTMPFVFGLGFVVWAIVAAHNRSKRLVVWVDQNGQVRLGPSGAVRTGP